MHLRYHLAHILDWFDDKVLGHRFYWFCQFVALRVWPDAPCLCRPCVIQRRVQWLAERYESSNIKTSEVTSSTDPPSPLR